MTETAQTVLLTLLALLAFASNSLLTRLALGAREIDAATFASVRLVSGALVLALVVRARTGAFAPLARGGVAGPLALFTYALPFSFAYLRVGAAAGALVLFGVVQITMISYGIARGERPTRLTWLGLALAAAGLCVLTLPAATRPDPLGVALMVLAGVGWAVYSLIGRTAPNPVAANARNFLLSSPLSIALSLACFGSAHASRHGLALAFTSGALTSGLGYVIWYAALPRLAVTQAAIAQLSVPVIAALGAVTLLGETLGARLLLAGSGVLLGVGLALSAALPTSSMRSGRVAEPRQLTPGSGLNPRARQRRRP